MELHDDVHASLVGPRIVSLLGAGKRLTIQAGLEGEDALIRWGDLDITNGVASLRLEMVAGKVNKVSFEMHPSAIDVNVLASPVTAGEIGAVK